jgi:uncharacterized protein
MRKKIGRERELKSLKEKYASKKSELVVIYGRRRVGKSYLIQQFIDTVKSKTSPVPLVFEGLENQRTTEQIKHFVSLLKNQFKDDLLQRAEFQNWHQLFDFLTSYFGAQQTKGKVIVAFDEFQWMAASQSKLVALIKYYWDNRWKQCNVMLILCGSIASFMVKKVMRSKALYGRFSLQLHVKKLLAHEVHQFFPKTKSLDEVLRFLLIFGGVPKYLEEIEMGKSFEQNLERLFFNENALFLEEFDKIFNVHFKEPRNYLNIVKALQKRTLNLDQIARHLKMKSSGGVKAYVENLELAEFVRSAYSYKKNQIRYTKYKLADEFVCFYTAFVLPHKRIIAEGGGRSLFVNKIKNQLSIWLGFAFENYFLNNALYFADIMGFADKVESFGAYYGKKEGVQIDLVYLRSDKTLSLCEMKCRTEIVSTEVIPEFEAKLKKFPRPKNYSIHKLLIAPNGASEALRKAEYFDQIVTSEDLFLL